MKIELTNKEVTTVIGALCLLSKVEKDDFGLRKLADKITKQNINELKKEVKNG